VFLNFLAVGMTGIVKMVYRSKAPIICAA